MPRKRKTGELVSEIELPTITLPLRLLDRGNNASAAALLKKKRVKREKARGDATDLEPVIYTQHTLAFHPRVGDVSRDVADVSPIDAPGIDAQGEAVATWPLLGEEDFIRDDLAALGPDGVFNSLFPPDAQTKPPPAFPASSNPFSNLSCLDGQRAPTDFSFLDAAAGPEASEAGYRAEDLYAFEKQNDVCFSTISRGFKFDMGLDLYAKPTSNAGFKSHALYKVQFVWKGALEDLLIKPLRPKKPVMDWDYKLLRALSRLVFYGPPEEMNSLLWAKVCDRKVPGDDSVIKTGEVYEVIAELEAKNRRPQVVSDEDYFG